MCTYIHGYAQYTISVYRRIPYLVTHFCQSVAGSNL